MYCDYKDYRKPQRGVVRKMLAEIGWSGKSFSRTGKKRTPIIIYDEHSNEIWRTYSGWYTVYKWLRVHYGKITGKPVPMVPEKGR